MLGRFLELSLATGDIAASVGFYEQLGFRQVPCTDSWNWPYCVLSDGRLCLGLHRYDEPRFTLSFVRPGLLDAMQALAFSGFVPHQRQLGFEDFHLLELRDPGGVDVRLLEARTCSPDSDGYHESQCGYFAALSIPAANTDASSDYWSRAGFIALRLAFRRRHRSTEKFSPRLVAR